ncbi:hypothetical protein CBL_07906 [Carabus blaptoides fortunei]
MNLSLEIHFLFLASPIDTAVPTLRQVRIDALSARRRQFHLWIDNTGRVFTLLSLKQQTLYSYSPFVTDVSASHRGLPPSDIESTHTTCVYPYKHVFAMPTETTLSICALADSVVANQQRHVSFMSTERITEVFGSSSSYKDGALIYSSRVFTLVHPRSAHTRSSAGSTKKAKSNTESFVS